MTHASLFSGIGGFDIAAEWAGWDNVFNCDIEPFCETVLKYSFKGAIHYGDIKTTDFTVWRGKIDVLTGGFPCQPFSTAGKRKGTADNRYLWPEMLRVIREIRPRWVVGENVLGIVNWDGGLVFEQVHADLEAEEYEVQAFVLPACSVGAPHLRYRVWFVAHANSNRQRVGKDKQIIIPGSCGSPHISSCSEDGVTPNSNSKRCQECNVAEKPNNEKIWYRKNSQHVQGWSRFPTKSPICSRRNGFPIPMDGITFSKWRSESIKAYGNAIVPQVAYRIFDTINMYESL